MYFEDDLEQVYFGNRMEVCDDLLENFYFYFENCFEDEDEDDYGERYVSGLLFDLDFYIVL